METVEFEAICEHTKLTGKGKPGGRPPPQPTPGEIAMGGRYLFGWEACGAGSTQPSLVRFSEWSAFRQV